MPPIIYEDDDLLVVNKPAGLLVHGTEARTLADLVRDVVEDDEPERPGIVHRLDKDTSGLIIIAKNPQAKAYLQAQFKDHRVQKTYLALVDGHLRHSQAIIDLPLARHHGNPTKWSVVGAGRQSQTAYKEVGQYGAYSLLEVKPRTGRTHQIRVHLSHLGHPIVGDKVYGGSQPLGLGRHFLHASALEFSSPSGKKVHLESPLPPDLQSFLDKLSGV